MRPALRRLLGHTDVSPPRVRGVCGDGYRKAAGLDHFVRVRASWETRGLVAHPLSSQTSGALRSAAGATHLMRVEAPVVEVKPGDPIDLYPLSWVG